MSQYYQQPKSDEPWQPHPPTGSLPPMQEQLSQFPQQWLSQPLQASQPKRKQRWSYADWYPRQPLHIKIFILSVLFLIIAFFGSAMLVAIVQSIIGK